VSGRDSDRRAQKKEGPGKLPAEGNLGDLQVELVRNNWYW
jgi:hypothetical protein